MTARQALAWIPFGLTKGIKEKAAELLRGIAVGSPELVARVIEEGLIATEGQDHEEEAER